MSQKLDFVVISGASGVGKTTVFDELTRRRNCGELDFRVPLKLTTRPRRDSDNPEEIGSVSNEEYRCLHENKRFLIEFERHGHKYGVLRPETGNEVLLQIIPARDVIPLRETFQDTVEFTIILLNASADVIHARRQSRGDKVSEAEEASRAKTVANKPVNEVDYIIDASQAPQTVADDVAKIVKNIAKKASCPSILRPDLVTEFEVLTAIDHIATTQGVTTCLFGGIAANLYGSARAITDVDLLADASDFHWLLSRYNHPEMTATAKKVSIQRVELNKTPARVGDRALGQEWAFDDEAKRRLRQFVINGHLFHVISPEDMIVMKAGLGRGEEQGKFDLYDVKNILSAQGSAGIDFSYIADRAEKCNAYDRVMASFRKLNFSLPAGNAKHSELVL